MKNKKEIKAWAIVDKETGNLYEIDGQYYVFSTKSVALRDGLLEGIEELKTCTIQIN